MRDEAQILQWLHAYAAECTARYLSKDRVISGWWQLEDFPTGRAMLEADPTEQIAVLCVTLRSSFHLLPQEVSFGRALLRDQLCRLNLPYTLEDIHTILQLLSGTDSPHHLFSRSVLQPLLEKFAPSLLHPEALAVCRLALERLLEAVFSSPYNPLTTVQPKSESELTKLIYRMLRGQRDTISIYPDDWGSQIAASFDEMEPDLQRRWSALLLHCSQAKGSVPGTKWLAQVPPLKEALGQQVFLRLATAWIDAFGQQKKTTRLYEENENLLKGLAWCCLEIEDQALTRTLADAAIEGYRKVGTLGPRSLRMATACVSVLKQMPGQYGAEQLERVRLNVKQPGYLKEIERALDEVVQRSGTSREDLEELSVPTFDLQEGCRRIAIGSASVELRIVGREVQMQWYDAAGKPRKAVPTEVKREQKAEIKDLKRLSDELASMLTAQRNRLEHLPLAERRWQIADWRERYLDHPLLSCIARRLIWRFSDGECTVDGIWLDGCLVDASDRSLDLPETTSVTTWHPIFAEASDVLAWRDFLDRHQITQPFKQAYREVYLLTEAERKTRLYSNRFAAHLLRQHQFHALTTARGWRNQLRLMVDDVYHPAMLVLPQYGLRAEFWIEGAVDEYGIDTNETGTYRHVETDQVRFYPLDAPLNYASTFGEGYGTDDDRGRTPSPRGDPLSLEQIPPLVFSEVMRDVDLFVGVASVGNDPTWYDGAHQYGRVRPNYWHSYSFGELSASAKTRKQVLERLIPRLTIANRCSLEDRFLKVRGDLRTYKIHLNSGNILMEPNDQYLCIVRSNGLAPDQLFLPFEDDSVLSIVLSKAFMLAEDSRITDLGIMSQIERQ